MYSRVYSLRNSKIKSARGLSWRVFENPVLPFVHDFLRASDREVEFFRQPFEGDSIEQSPAENRPVPLGVPAPDPFFNEPVNIASSQVGKLRHAFTFPLPWQLGQVFCDGLLDVRTG